MGCLVEKQDKLEIDLFQYGNGTSPTMGLTVSQMN